VRPDHEPDARRVEVRAPAASGGPLAEWLLARGASPYAATLRTRGGPAGPLDETKTFGARLALGV